MDTWILRKVRFIKMNILYGAKKLLNISTFIRNDHIL
jgi:hypothetical protein